ncbi:MAG: D-alanyl-D-alanine carboxypeptidase family protein, partial [Clostridia bacterium]
ALGGICTATDVSAKSAILIEASSGKVIYEKNADNKRQIASTTKIMTAIIALENAQLDKQVTIKKTSTDIEGTSIYLKPGEIISVNCLLHGMMLQSGNDASIALAEHVGGSVDKFVKMMNTRAAALGMNNTVFKNPNGLPAEGQFSTARDMARLSAYAMSRTDFRAIVSKKTYSEGGRFFKNHNKLLNMRDDIDGVKTGFTKSAGRCLVSSAKQNDMRLVAVTLYAPNDWDDHINLYNYGFEKFQKVLGLSAGQHVYELPVAGSGLCVSTVSERALTWVGAKDLKDVHLEIDIPRFVYPPISVGDKLGTARIICGEKTLAETKIISLDSVALPKKESLWQW